MTAVLPSVSTDRPPPAVAVLPTASQAAEPLTVTVHPVLPGTVVIAVRDEVDLCTSPLQHARLLANLHDTIPHVIIDLTEVSFFGAAGLTVLVTTRQAATAAGIRLSIVARTRRVMLPLSITEMADVFDFYPDLPHALRRLGGGLDG